MTNFTKTIPFDGMEMLVKQFGQDDFVRFVVSSCYFFSEDLVIARHKMLCDHIERGVAVPARLSTKKKYYGGKRLKRKTQEVIFNQGDSRDILTKIDGNGNANIDSIISKLTGYYLKGNTSRTPDFINYKISHIWGNSFHPCFFTSLWNVVLVPLFVNDILDKPSALNGSYLIGAKILNTIKAVISAYYDLENFDWKTFGITPPSYDKNFVLPDVYTINVLRPCNNKIPVTPEKVDVLINPRIDVHNDKRDNEVTDTNMVNEEEEIRQLLGDIGMTAFVSSIYPALKRDFHISASDLAKENPDFAKYTANAQNSRLSKARKLFEKGWEDKALLIVADSYRVPYDIRSRALYYLSKNTPDADFYSSCRFKELMDML